MEASIKQDILTRIEGAVENIRPYLKADGGDVRIIDIDDSYVVHLELLGACEACPMSPMTMKAGIEEAIKRVAPEVKGIQADNVAAAS
jgi:Fe-S cluster biogenesis protein NfuA